MILTISGLVALFILLRVAWFFWKNWDRYIGTDRRHKFFAEFFKDFPLFYNPRTLHLKKKLFEGLAEIEPNFPELRKVKGIRILEIGAGSGANLEFYPDNTKLTVADPNPYFKEILNENLKKFPNIELERYVITGAEDMKDVPSNSMDAVVSTMVLCSVKDIHQVCKEVSRVLVPGGKFLVMEHVLDDHMSLVKIGQLFYGLSGVWPFLVDGCRPDRNIKEEISKAGFVTTDIKRFRLDLTELPSEVSKVIYMIEPHIYGVAKMEK